jgi:hypothetical protein
VSNDTWLSNAAKARVLEERVADLRRIAAGYRKMAADSEQEAEALMADVDVYRRRAEVDEKIQWVKTDQRFHW